MCIPSNSYARQQKLQRGYTLYQVKKRLDIMCIPSVTFAREDISILSQVVHCDQNNTENNTHDGRTDPLNVRGVVTHYIR